LGYIVGLKYAAIICFGSMAVWWLIVPGMSLIFHDTVLNIGGSTITQTVGEMSPEDIFSTYARSIGIGGIAMAGVIGIIKSWGIIKSAVGLAAKEIKGTDQPKQAENDNLLNKQPRTQRDLSFRFIGIVRLRS
jgi:uncharacterized oligopeptide transporter (OPT) family protein